MIYTSRYTNPELNSEKYYVVGITLGKPKFLLKYSEKEHCYFLAPDKSMWGKSHEEFEALYREKLEKHGIHKVAWYLNNLQEKAGDKDVVLVCYEDVRDPNQHCHRTTLADWVREKKGIEIKELQDPSPIKYVKPKKEKKDDDGFVQMSFFDLIETARA